jgi:hypothetical protein
MLKGYKVYSDSLIHFSERAMQIFDGFWKWEADRVARYIFETDIPQVGNYFPGTPSALSHEIAMGKVYIYLYLLTNRKAYLDKIKGLVRLFKGELKYNEKNNLYIMVC